MSEKNNSSIYLISPPEFFFDDFIKQFLSVLDTGFVSVFQLRMKNSDKQEIYDVAKSLSAYCHNYGIQFILNDYPDIAKEIDADGVHIGNSDMDFKKARKIMGDDKIIGVSCYNSIDRAIDLASLGADYVSFGAFYETSTKKDTVKAETDIIKWWVRNSVIPCAAIGGINSENAGELVRQGADFISVISYIWDNPNGPVTAIKNLKDSIENAGKLC